jgi:hypothetical protein
MASAMKFNTILLFLPKTKAGAYTHQACSRCAISTNQIMKTMELMENLQITQISDEESGKI